MTFKVVQNYKLPSATALTNVATSAVVPAIASNKLITGTRVTITNSPLAKGLGLEVDTDGSFVRIPDDARITVTNNMPISSGLGKMFANSVYIDPLNGNDSAAGTAIAPKRTLNEGGAWSGGGVGSYSPGMYALFKRGTTYTRNNGTSLAVNANQGIGAYGDPSSPKPVLRNTFTASNPGVVEIGAPDGARVCDITVDGAGITNRHGIYAYTFGASIFQNLVIADVDVINIRQTVNANPLLNNAWFSGIQINRSASGNQSALFNRASNVRIEGCTLTNMGGHAIGIIGATGVLNATTGLWGGFDVIGNKVNDYGQDIDSHGITVFSQLNPGWTGNGTAAWTLVSGTVYSFPLSTQISQLTPAVDFLTVYLQSVPRGYFLLNYGTTAPGGGVANLPAGYFFFDSAASPQQLYVNYSTAVNTNTSTGDQFVASCSGPQGIRLIDNVVSGCAPIKLNTQYREGHAYAFDDYVSNSYMINCKALNAGGVGVSSNRGFMNTFLFNQLIGCQAGAMGLGLGIGHVVEQNILASPVPVGLTVGNRGVCNFGSLFSMFNSTIPQSRIRRNIIHAQTGTQNGNVFDGFVGTGTGFYQGPLILSGNVYSSDDGVSVADIGYGKCFGR